MLLIEGIGDEVTQFFIGLLAIVLVYVAWWSTNITEQRHYRTVLLLDQRRRRARSILQVRIPRQLSNHTEAVTISEGSSTTTTTSTQIEESSLSSEASSNLSQTSQIQPKSNEIATSSNNTQPTEEIQDSLQSLGSETTPNNLETISEFEERDIIQTMDADTQNTVRLRRLAHFEGTASSGNENNSVESEESHIPLSSSENHNSSASNSDNNHATKAFLSDNSNKGSENVDPSKMTIKLKYINDDIKIVDGRPDESLGDFKLRHFSTELNSNKIIRLIFNGQVLKQDRQTLQNCGLFDNCVVHCLIHQNRALPGEGQAHEIDNQHSEFFTDHPFAGVTNINNNNQGIDWDLGNFLFALISFLLLAAWYFRYVYAHLYTVTATVGLLIITGMFSIVVIGTFFPDNDQLHNPNTRIRVARA